MERKKYEWKQEVLTPKSKRWNTFVTKLEGKEGCNFTGKGKNIKWTCDATKKRPLARKILSKIRGVNIPATLRYFTLHGGHCDCEILFNVDK